MPNSIVAIKSSQILVLRDYAENIKRMLEMIEKVDVMVPDALRAGGHPHQVRPGHGHPAGAEQPDGRRRRRHDRGQQRPVGGGLAAAAAAWGRYGGGMGGGMGGTGGMGGYGSTAWAATGYQPGMGRQPMARA